MLDNPREGHQGRLGKIDRPEYVALREVLAEAMDRERISQRQLSAKLGRPHVYINRIMAGRKSIEWADLVDICAAIPADVGEVVVEAMRRSTF